MNRWIGYGFTFVLALSIGLTLGRLINPPKSLANPIGENHNAVIESVPDAPIPEAVRSLDFVTVYVRVDGTFGSNGKISNLTEPAIEFGEFSDLIAQKNLSEAEVARLERDLAKEVLDQVAGIRFKPRIINGESQSSELYVLATFSVNDARAKAFPRGKVAGCNEIQLNIYSDTGLVWVGNTDVNRTEFGCILYD